MTKKDILDHKGKKEFKEIFLLVQVIIKKVPLIFLNSSVKKNLIRFASKSSGFDLSRKISSTEIKNQMEFKEHENNFLLKISKPSLIHKKQVEIA